MQRYILTRLLQVLVAMLAVSMVVFLAIRFTGDPRDVLLPPDATEEDYRLLGQELGLDKPIIVQYEIFLANAIKLDFGRSIRTGWPVRGLVLVALSTSVKLATGAMVVGLFIVLPLGVIAAVRRGSAIDTAVRLFAVLGQAMPSFWLGIIFILIFSVHLRWLPSFGATGIKSYILPSLVMGWGVSAGLTRLLRSSMLEVLDSEFVTMARVKGVSESAAILQHALRNALIPVVTFAGLYFGLMIGMAIVIETVFALPGLGRLAYQAMLWRDYPLFQGVILLTSAIVMISNLFVDVLYAYLDPRIRY